MSSYPPSGPDAPWQGYDRRSSWGPAPTGPAIAPAPGGWPAPPPALSPPLPPPPRKPRSRAPIVLAVVGATVGLVVLVLALTALVRAGLADLEEDVDEAVYERPTMTGQLAATHVPGTGVTGAELQTAITPVIEDGFGYVDEMACPNTPRVDQSVTTVCHGTIDDEGWSVVVVFEDQAGRFTLLTA